jgi:hypothetical protein
MLKRILSLNSSVFLRGLAVSPYEENVAVFDVADGIDFYRSIGLLGSGLAKTDLDSGGTVVTDTPNWFVPSIESGVAYLYCLGNTGRLYKIATATNSVSYIGAQISVSSAQGQGIAIGEAVSGTVTNLVYTKNTDIRKNVIPPVSASDTSIGTVTNSAYHPVYFAHDQEFYIGDINQVDNWNGNSYVSGALDLSSEMTITCFENDGYNLLVGATNNPTALNQKATSKVYFWNTWGTTWQKEWTIPDKSITAIKRDGSWFYGFGGRALWRFNYNTEPQRVLSQNQVDANLPSFVPMAGGVDLWNGMLIWGDATKIACYGSPDERLPLTITKPLAGLTEARGLVGVDLAKVYVGDSNKLYGFYTGNYAGTATTSLIDLGGTYKIWGIKIVAKALASGQSLTASLQNEAGTNIVSGTFSYAADGASTTKKILAKGSASNLADQVIISLALTGNVRIKRVDVFGELQPLTWT